MRKKRMVSGSVILWSAARRAQPHRLARSDDADGHESDEEYGSYGDGDGKGSRVETQGEGGNGLGGQSCKRKFRNNFFP